jgi:hypothetical protein
MVADHAAVGTPEYPRVRCCIGVDRSQLQAERELLADIQRMAAEVHAGFNMRESAAVWMKRRVEIAELRQRIRTMRAEHLDPDNRGAEQSDDVPVL